MKVVVIGASGTTGSSVAEALSARHAVIRVARTNGDYHADLAS